MKLAIVAIGSILAAAFLAPTAARAAITDIVAHQSVIANDALYTAADSIDVDFTSDAAGDVTVSVFAAKPLGIGQRWYANDATQCATFATTAKVGAQRFTFKLADLAPPKKPMPGGAMDAQMGTAKPPGPETLPGTFVVEVADGKTTASVTLVLHRAGEALIASRTIPGYALGAARDSKGNIIVADRQHWVGRRYSAAFAPLEAFPQAGMGHGSNPVECYDVAVDSKDTVYVMTRNGAYKFSSDGQAADYTADADYLKCPYPSSVKNVLGVRLDASFKEKHRYVFGPGGGGAGSKDYGPDDVKNPGFSYNWMGIAIDAADNIYLGSGEPVNEVQVFDSTGKYLRKFPMPEKLLPLTMRIGPDGTLWVSDGNKLWGFDAQTGAVKKSVDGGSRLIHLGPDGTIYTFNGGQIRRFNPDGTPKPFTTTSPIAQDKGAFLDINPATQKVTPGTAGYTTTISSVVGEKDGSFYVLGRDTQDVNAENNPLRVMRFDADGSFKIDSPATAVLPHETGNIFVGDEPAAVDVQVNNLTAEASAIDVDVVVTDLLGATLAKSTQQLSVPPMSSSSRAVSLGAELTPKMGYYQIALEARSGGRSVGATRLFGGRVAPRGNDFHPYSAFGSVRMEANPELMRRIGGGLNRNHNPVYWNEVEPTPGQWRLQPPDALSIYKDHAMPAMVILGYGEPWFNGGFQRCRITEFDAFWNYAATVINHHKNTAMMWQCWNEPNYFWHSEGPYRYEQYAIALQGIYSIAKALDPQADVICDGFAASAADLGVLADQGAAGFTDGVPIHYPGAKTITFDNMPLEGTVESKVTMVQELVKIRDAKFPGKQLMNTEEGVWGVQNRTPITGAQMLARIYVSQMAVGMDRLTWFEAFSAEDPGYLLRGEQDGPWPGYFAYATASGFLEDAQFVAALSGGLAQVHLFSVAGKPVIVAWSIEEDRETTIDVGGATSVSITDWQGNAAPVKSNEGKISIKLTPYAQFITGAGLQVYATAIKNDETPGVAADGPKMALNDLFYAARQAIVRAPLPRAANRLRANSVEWATKELDAAIENLKTLESDGRYLRDTHTVLSIAKRSAYFMKHAQDAGEQNYANNLADSVGALAHQVKLYADSEKPWYPGVMVRVALDTKAIREATEPKIAAARAQLIQRAERVQQLKTLEAALDPKTPDPAKQQEIQKLREQINADQQPLEPTPLDEQFAPQVNKKAGDSVQVEMTIYNWTDHLFSGSLEPVLPEGWSTGPEMTVIYEVKPKSFIRGSVTVTVPPGTKAGIYPIGATTQYKGTGARELHASRVNVVP